MVNVANLTEGYIPQSLTEGTQVTIGGRKLTVGVDYKGEPCFHGARGAYYFLTEVRGSGVSNENVYMVSSINSGLLIIKGNEWRIRIHNDKFIPFNATYQRSYRY